MNSASMSRREGSQLVAHDIVLEAKAILSAMPGATLLSRERFIRICVEASLAFLHEKKQNNHKGENVHKSHSKLSPPAHVDKKKDGKDFHHYRSSGSRGRRVRADINGRRGNSGDCSKQREENGKPKLWQSLLLSEGDLERLRELVDREYCNLSQDSMGEIDETDITQFTVLPPAKLEAASIVRRVLDGPYRRGDISRQQYSVIVIAVLEKLFPDLVSVMNGTLVPNNDVNSHSNNGDSTGGSKSNDMDNNETELILEKTIMIDPQQDVNTPLRPDVVELAVHLTEQALRHYMCYENNNNNNNNNNKEQDSTNSPNNCIHGIKTELFSDTSPHPQNPYDCGILNRTALSVSSTLPLSYSVHFDDAFEQQVEKLRRLLEEKYALDLSGAHATTTPTLPHRNGSDVHCETALTANNILLHTNQQEKRERLITEALRCQEELHKTQERLGSIMHELCETENIGGTGII